MQDGPYIWYPFNKYVVIRLSTACLSEPNRALFQLAHEAVHLLSPTGDNQTNVLEEALASWYQLKVAADNPDLFGDKWCVLPPRYQYAYELVSPILKQFPSSIKQIRLSKPTINEILLEDLEQMCPGADRDVLEKLASPFAPIAERMSNAL